MKKLIIILILSVSIITIGAKRIEKIPEPYASSINFLKQKSVVSGYPDGTYRIDWAITQGEFITLLVRAYNMTHIYETGEQETFIFRLKRFINSILSFFKKKKRFVELKEHWVHPYIIELSRLIKIAEDEVKPDTPITIEEALFFEINLFKFREEIKGITLSTAKENKEKILSCSVSHNLFPEGIRFTNKLSRGDAFLLIEQFIKKKRD